MSYTIVGLRNGFQRSASTLVVSWYKMAKAKDAQAAMSTVSLKPSMSVNEEPQITPSAQPADSNDTQKPQLKSYNLDRLASLRSPCQRSTRRFISGRLQHTSRGWKKPCKPWPTAISKRLLGKNWAGPTNSKENAHKQIPRIISVRLENSKVNESRSKLEPMQNSGRIKKNIPAYSSLKPKVV